MMGMWWLHPWSPRAANVPWRWPALTAVLGQGLTPNQRVGASQLLQVQMKTQGIIQPGSYHHSLAQAWEQGQKTWEEVQGGNRKHRKQDGVAIAKRKQDFVSFSSSLESCSSPSASPQSGWCCLWEDQRYLFFSFWWDVFVMRQWGRNHSEKISAEINESEGIAACSSAAINELKEQNPVAPVKQLKTTITRHWAWETETALVC